MPRIEPKVNKKAPVSASFLFIFVSFVQSMKNIAASQIRTRIVGAEIQDTDHYTTTTAHLSNYMSLLTLLYKASLRNIESKTCWSFKFFSSEKPNENKSLNLRFRISKNLDRPVKQVLLLLLFLPIPGFIINSFSMETDVMSSFSG